VYVAYGKLRLHRISAYEEECTKIVEKITSGQPDGAYKAYLTTKGQAQHDIVRVLTDVREILAAA